MKIKTILAGIIMFALLAAFANAGNIIARGGNLFVDNLLGIGTTTPDSNLDVVGAIEVSGSDNIILNSNYLSGDGDDEGIKVGADGMGSITRNYATNGNTPISPLALTRIYDGGAGADGIGVDLYLQAETETEGTVEPIGIIRSITTDATAGTVDSYFKFYNYINSVATSVFDTLNGNLNIGSNYLSGDGDDEGITVESNGAVRTSSALITGGTATIGGDLSVAGAGLSTETRHIEVGTGRTGNGYSYIDFTGDTTYSDYGLRMIRHNSGANTPSQIVHRGTGTFELETTEAGDMFFSTSATQRMRISGSTGYIAIGTDTTPNTLLDVEGGKDSWFVAEIYNTDADHGSGLLIKSGDSTSEAILRLENKDESPKFYFNAGGEAYCYGTSPCWNNPSSRALKENIKELKDNELDNILQEFKDTPVYFFKRKDDPEKKVQLGLVAEDSPDWFTKSDNATMPDAKNSISIGAQTNFLWAVVKAQQIQIDELKARIGALEVK